MGRIEIGDKIKSKRKEREYTQQELADILGVTKAAISKWETAESYPDITMLPQIANFFHITMDELFGYHSEFIPVKIINTYSIGFSLCSIEDKSLLDHGSIKTCTLEKCGNRDGNSNPEWEVRVQLISSEDDFPQIVQKCIKSGCLIDGCSYRTADGKIIDDDKPNKHYICKEKIWEYNINNRKYMLEMIKEQIEMGLISEEDTY